MAIFVMHPQIGNSTQYIFVRNAYWSISLNLQRQTILAKSETREDNKNKQEKTIRIDKIPSPWTMLTGGYKEFCFTVRRLKRVPCKVTTVYSS